jgi:hypothetical protein
MPERKIHVEADQSRSFDLIINFSEKKMHDANA